MPEIYLKQPKFPDSACGPQKGDWRKIYKNEFYKAGFHHNMAYRNFKYLARRTASDNVLRDEALNIDKSKIWWVPNRSCFYGL